MSRACHSIETHDDTANAVGGRRCRGRSGRQRCWAGKNNNLRQFSGWVDLDEQSIVNIPSTGVPALALPAADQAPTVRFVEAAKDTGRPASKGLVVTTNRGGRRGANLPRKEEPRRFRGARIQRQQWCPLRSRLLTEVSGVPVLLSNPADRAANILLTAVITLSREQPAPDSMVRNLSDSPVERAEPAGELAVVIAR